MWRVILHGPDRFFSDRHYAVTRVLSENRVAHLGSPRFTDRWRPTNRRIQADLPFRIWLTVSLCRPSGQKYVKDAAFVSRSVKLTWPTISTGQTLVRHLSLRWNRTAARTHQESSVVVEVTFFTVELPE